MCTIVDQEIQLLLIQNIDISQLWNTIICSEHSCSHNTDSQSIAMWMKRLLLQVLAYILLQNAMRRLSVMKVSILSILHHPHRLHKIPRKAIKSVATYFANLLHNVLILGFRTFTTFGYIHCE